jgi:serine kinase of HPr protein (carbohydrate metabolism regulator)
VSCTLLIHATAVAIDTAAGRRAVLLRGPSGSGKSDLGLRLIDAGARLVADDQSELYRKGDSVVVRSPPPIAGLIEVRGVGIVRVEPLAEAPVGLIVDLVWPEAAPEAIERLPGSATERLLEVDLPCIRVAPFEASAAAKVALALRAFAGTGLPAIIE